MHVAEGAPTCITAEQAFPGPPSGCGHGAVETDAALTAPGYGATLRAGAASTLATIEGRTFSIEVVRNIRRTTDPELYAAVPGATVTCADVIIEEVAVVIGPG